ncbi:MAG: hypothetical protein JWN43_3575, partial [Gammaproteobacteria bacterium]|nr:hypothetical protein [Gammaproteobacteria bacterium]
MLQSTTRICVTATICAGLVAAASTCAGVAQASDSAGGHDSGGDSAGVCSGLPTHHQLKVALESARDQA